MPSSAKPLWTCPKCGVKLITRNLVHSRGRATLEDWKKRMGRAGCGAALPCRSGSSPPRFIKVEEVAPGWWGHWLRVTDVAELDEQVAGWIAQSYRSMGLQER